MLVALLVACRTVPVDTDPVDTDVPDTDVPDTDTGEPVDPTDPPAFPPESQAALAFDLPFEALVPTRATHHLHVAPSPAGVVVTPDRVAHHAREYACTRVQNTLSCAAESLVTNRDFGHGIAFPLFEIRLFDGDGDGTAESGWLRVRAIDIAPMLPPAEYPVYTELVPDTTPATAVLSDALLPTDPVIAVLSEPIRVTDAVLTGPDAPFEVDWLVPGIAVRLHSTAVPGWGTTPGIAGDLEDLAGNPVGVVAGQVAPDPGPLTSNASFEGPGGWATHIAELGPVSQIEPVEGTGLAWFPREGALVGETVLPDTATTLRFQYTQQHVFFPYSVALDLVTPDGRHNELWRMLEDEMVPCGTHDCVPWTEAAVDIQPWAGERVFLRWVVERDAPDALEPPRWLRTVAPSFDTDVAIDGVHID
ncbi:MAG: hypothetical protein H6737_32050 [Alphaproteobacteria bacterium]|nr:hypothetical protein [Alphaproteobacteria bacterium]